MTGDTRTFNVQSLNVSHEKGITGHLARCYDGAFGTIIRPRSSMTMVSRAYLMQLMALLLLTMLSIGVVVFVSAPIDRPLDYKAGERSVVVSFTNSEKIFSPLG
jgi:hypothetical protein